MGGLDKLFAELAGRPLLAWTLAAFKTCAAIDNIVVVASPDSVDRVRALVTEWRFDSSVSGVIPGGTTRQDSVRAGLAAVKNAPIVAVHDGARPLVTPDLIERGVALAHETGAAVCAVPARDTVKLAAGQPPVVKSTLARESLWLAQTPQCFDRELLIEAHRATEVNATDDAALVEALGHAVTIYEGATSNLKVTTMEDLVLAEALMRERYLNVRD